MEISRKTELSIYYEIQNLFSRLKTKEKPKSLDYKTYTLSNKEILPQYDVAVYVNGTEQFGGFTINYPNGSITFDTALTNSDVVEVTYGYCYVNLYDEGKNPEDEDYKVPAVAIHETNGTGKAIELGNSKRRKFPSWMFEVASNRGGERSDMTDIIVEYLEETLIPIIDYDLGFPVNSDGTKNKGFNKASQTIGYIITERINYAKGGSLNIGNKPMYLTNIIAKLSINI